MRMVVSPTCNCARALAAASRTIRRPPHWRIRFTPTSFLLPLQDLDLGFGPEGLVESRAKAFVFGLLQLRPQASLDGFKALFSGRRVRVQPHDGVRRFDRDQPADRAGLH